MYHTPSALSGKSFEDQLNILEEFWDSEVPRAGEPGATGWATWEASNRPDLSPPPSTKLPDLNSRISDPYSKWAASEALADRIRALSLRSTDDEDSEDPYAVVLFSDIRSFLVPVRSEHAKEIFRRVWLEFVWQQKRRGERKARLGDAVFAGRAEDGCREGWVKKAGGRGGRGGSVQTAMSSPCTRGRHQAQAHKHLVQTSHNTAPNRRLLH